MQSRWKASFSVCPPFYIFMFVHFPFFFPSLFLFLKHPSMASRIARPTIYNINKPSKRRTDEPLICNRRKTPFVLGQKVRIPSLSLTGIVRYIGETKFKPNEIWIGIELDVRGTGKNDGCIQGLDDFIFFIFKDSFIL